MVAAAVAVPAAAAAAPTGPPARAAVLPPGQFLPGGMEDQLYNAALAAVTANGMAANAHFLAAARQVAATLQSRAHAAALQAPPWPPAAHVMWRAEAAGPSLSTFSWLYVPVLALAVDRADLARGFANAWPTLPVEVKAAIISYRMLFTMLNIQHATIFTADGGAYVPAQVQEATLNLLPITAQRVTHYAIGTAVAALRAAQPAVVQQPAPAVPTTPTRPAGAATVARQATRLPAATIAAAAAAATAAIAAVQGRFSSRQRRPTEAAQRMASQQQSRRRSRHARNAGPPPPPPNGPRPTSPRHPSPLRAAAATCPSPAATPSALPTTGQGQGAGAAHTPTTDNPRPRAQRRLVVDSPQPMHVHGSPGPNAAGSPAAVNGSPMQVSPAVVAMQGRSPLGGRAALGYVGGRGRGRSRARMLAVGVVPSMQALGGN